MRNSGPFETGEKKTKKGQDAQETYHLSHKLQAKVFCRGCHEGCLNDSLILAVGNQRLDRKCYILWHKVTAKHTADHIADTQNNVC